MNEKIENIARRIKGLRELEGISTSEMAAVADVSEKDYTEYESGSRDFSFTFLYLVAGRLGVDITELLTGDRPKLSLCSLVRAGEGLPIERRKGFNYQHMAYMFKDKTGEPFCVTAKYEGEVEAKNMPLSRHKGQEFDMVLSGRLKFVIEGHEMLLGEGDAVYYDSSYGHGMSAVGGDCTFLAVVMKAPDEKQGTEA